jgi:hypothetical protein
MRYLLPILMITIPTLASAQADQAPPPRLYDLKVTAEQLNTIIGKLTEMPWKDINQLMVELSKQIQAQNAPPPAPPKE